jgi:hypothetical protein
MPVNATAILVLQILLSLVTFVIIARWYLLPRLSPLPLATALPPLLLFNTFRTLGLVFLLPGVVGDTLPAAFTIPAAVGNMTAVALAFLALGALRWGGAAWWALVVVWLFNLEGTADFLFSYAAGLYLDLANAYSLGPAYFIPAYFVPAALVVHGVIFVLLLRPRKPNEVKEALAR